MYNFVDKALYDILLNQNSVILKKYDIWGRHGLHQTVGGVLSATIMGTNINMIQAILTDHFRAEYPIGPIIPF